MELKYSTTGSPYIELDDSNRLIFSTLTADKVGFKWLVFSGMSTTTAAVSSGKGKKKTKRKVTSHEPLRAMIDMTFAGVPKTKTTNAYLSKKYLNGMKRMFDPYLIDGILPYANVIKLEKVINNDGVINKEDLLEEDPNGYYEEDIDEIDD